VGLVPVGPCGSPRSYRAVGRKACSPINPAFGLARSIVARRHPSSDSGSLSHRRVSRVWNWHRAQQGSHPHFRCFAPGGRSHSASECCGARTRARKRKRSAVIIKAAPEVVLRRAGIFERSATRWLVHERAAVRASLNHAARCVPCSTLVSTEHGVPTRPTPPPAGR
jgi:hypothetical protein